MTELFHPLSPARRRPFLDDALRELRRRDGTINGRARTASAREAFCDDIEAHPVKWPGAPIVDAAAFDRNYRRLVPEPHLDRPTLWALCVAKFNFLELFGVEYSFETNSHEG